MANQQDLKNWYAPAFPEVSSMEGAYAKLELLSADAHAASLFRANSADDRIWEYMPYGPFASSSVYHRWMREITAGSDPRFYAIFNKDSKAWEGVASYLRIKPEIGVIEVGHINMSPALQKTRAATEAVYLMIKWAFDAGYRRFEWKCDAANVGSRRAAERFGLNFEGVFRQATIVKGRNRDTAWFAAIDSEWPALSAAFEAWLAPSNFTNNAQQIERLGDLTQLVRVSSDPSL